MFLLQIGYVDQQAKFLIEFLLQERKTELQLAQANYVAAIHSIVDMKKVRWRARMRKQPFFLLISEHVNIEISACPFLFSSSATSPILDVQQ